MKLQLSIRWFANEKPVISEGAPAGLHPVICIMKSFRYS